MCIPSINSISISQTLWGLQTYSEILKVLVQQLLFQCLPKSYIPVLNLYKKKDKHLHIFQNSATLVQSFNIQTFFFSLRDAFECIRIVINCLWKLVHCILLRFCRHYELHIVNNDILTSQTQIWHQQRALLTS